ncbi:cobalt ECF transporter T component CbiQ [Baaleninema simplex]|uniref:cobalt ECF transporter T component CbiQ n=1 Tax=Baaleninema simplex TaxID=2862350 RepID=UPI0003498CE8|nr:cobalt ECF transporter T component CbiQ [Baaleninema simplex]
MRHGLDEYARLDSPLHRWEPRCKFVGLMALIFAFSFIEDLYLLLPMLGITVLLYKLSRLPKTYWCDRLHYPGYFLLGVVVVLPFVSGETILFEIAGLAVRWEGLLDVVEIATRFLCIVTVSLVLFGTSPIATTLRAMRSLGVPSLITDMMLLFYRYLYETLDRLTQVQTAMRLRGFNRQQLSWRNLRILASLAGTLLVTSYEQSEQVYRAMRLRGYGRSTARVSEIPVRTVDAIALGGVLAVSLTLVVLQSLGIEIWKF